MHGLSYDIYINVHNRVEPSIRTYTLSKRDQFLILASDGLWELISPAWAVQIVSNYGLSRYYIYIYWYSSLCGMTTITLYNLHGFWMLQFLSKHHHYRRCIYFVFSSAEKFNGFFLPWSIYIYRYRYRYIYCIVSSAEYAHELPIPSASAALVHTALAEVRPPQRDMHIYIYIYIYISI